jgi:hypothetical protein
MNLTEKILAKLDELRKLFYLSGWLNKKGDEEMLALLTALRRQVEK